MKERKEREFNLKQYLKNAIRRASYRHPARQEVIKAARIPAPPDWPNKRVKWVAPCVECHKLFELGDLQCDHIEPIVPVTGWPDAPKSSLYDWMPGLPDWNVIIYRTFVSPRGMRMMCKPCHKTKSGTENKARRAA